MPWPAERLRPVLALATLGLLLSAATALTVAGRRTPPEAELRREANRRLVRELGLTDLALWSEASYCRHPTQADGFSAWADQPAALERFPAGSLVPPQGPRAHAAPRRSDP